LALWPLAAQVLGVFGVPAVTTVISLTLFAMNASLVLSFGAVAYWQDMRKTPATSR
jgi:hypothetical protein